MNPAVMLVYKVLAGHISNMLHQSYMLQQQSYMLHLKVLARHISNTLHSAKPTRFAPGSKNMAPPCAMAFWHASCTTSRRSSSKMKPFTNTVCALCIRSIAFLGRWLMPLSRGQGPKSEGGGGGRSAGWG